MSKKAFIGNWRITEMEQWDQDFIDAEVPGYISFGENGMGKFQFGYVHGFMDCRYSDGVRKQTVEFSWEGNDEMDPVSGRGFAFAEDDNLSEHLFFHEGDDSEFKAIREQEYLKNGVTQYFVDTDYLGYSMYRTGTNWFSGKYNVTKGMIF